MFVILFKHRVTKNSQPVRRFIVNIHRRPLNGTAHDKRSQSSAEFHSSILHNWKSLGANWMRRRWVAFAIRVDCRIRERERRAPLLASVIHLCPVARAIHQSLSVVCNIFAKLRRFVQTYDVAIIVYRSPREDYFRATSVTFLRFPVSVLTVQQFLFLPLVALIF